MVKAKERLKKPVLKSEAEPDGMSPEELKAYEAKSESAKAVYLAQLGAQTAQDALEKAKADELKARDTAKRSRAIEAGVKRIVSAVRGGEEKLENVLALLANLAQTSTGATVFKTDGLTEGFTSLNVTAGEAAALYPRIEEESKKAAPSGGGGGTSPARIPTPTYSLSHSLALVTKDQLEEPTDGGRPDATLAALFRIYPAISPLLLLPGTDGGRYRIFDGKRRYYLLDEKTSYPAVIVSGFPDEGTQEAAEIAVNRGRTLNVLRTGEVIARARTRGKSDADIRRLMGMKTAEPQKYASAATLPAPLAEALKSGRMTPTTALLLAKSSKSVVEAVTRSYEERKGKETADAPARVTEADVDEARQAGAKDAIERDTPTLTGLTGGVSGEDATGVQGAAGAPAGSQGVSGGSGASEGESGAGAPPEKGLDNGSSGADTGAAWVEAAFEHLGGVLEAIPQDAPGSVLSLYQGIHAQLTGLAGGIEFATVPELTPAPTFKAPKKAAVENTVEARAGWKASVLSRYKGLREIVPADAPPELQTALEGFRSAVADAKPGATS
jgi:hypothetical protein